MAQICVIGGGIAGMAAAARLAAKRHEVTVLEATDTLGGQTGHVSPASARSTPATTASSGPALTDTGPTLLTLPAVYRDLFLKTGRPIEDELELTELEPGYSYHFADASELTLPGGSVGRTVTAIAEQMGAESAAGWESLTRYGASMWKDLRQLWVQPSHSHRDRSRLRSPRVRGMGAAAHRNLYLLAKQLFTDPRMVQILSRYAGRNGWDPRQAPTSLAVHPFIEQTFGLWHVTGGMTTFAEAVARRCESLGVTFLTQARASRILTTSGTVSGVALADGPVQPAQIVVGALPAQTLYAELLRDLPGARRLRRIERLPRAHARFVLHLADAGPTSAAFAKSTGGQHHVWFPRSSVGEYDEIATGQPANQPTIYGHSEQQDAGRHLWQFVVNAPNPLGSKRPYRWTQERSQAYAQHLLKLLAGRGLDLTESAHDLRTTSPADFAALGQSFGYTPRGRKGPARQPSNETGVANVYAVGNDAHPGYGLAQAGLSAEIVADLIGKA